MSKGAALDANTFKYQTACAANMQTCEKLVRMNKIAHEVGMGRCSELLPQTAEAITSLLLLRWPPHLWKLKRQD